jgi:glutaredoxin
MNGRQPKSKPKPVLDVKPKDNLCVYCNVAQATPEKLAVHINLCSVKKNKEKAEQKKAAKNGGKERRK